jgi:DNA-directed RNA polymerase subunit alpha
MFDYHVTLPSKPKVITEEGKSGTYEIDGLHPGYGYTLGNSLRRIILSSLPGAAITQVKIDGVKHEFSTIDGIKEDVVTILLHLRRVRVRLLTDEPQVLILKTKGPKTVTAADITVPGQAEILNPEEYIAELSGKANLDIEITVERGLGYLPKEAVQKDRVDIGIIPLDATFSPIRRVNYEVENMRVGDRTDYNRLRIFIETDGTLSAREALERSIEIMIHQLRAVVGFKEEEEVPEDTDAELKEDASVGRKVDEKTDMEALKVRVSELQLSPRVISALDGASIRTIGGVVRKREDDLLAIEGLGQKGLQEVKRALSNYGLTLRP